MQLRREPVIESDHMESQTAPVMASSQPTDPRGSRWRLPPAGWDPPTPAGPAPDLRRRADEARLELVRRAEALDIPWERILQDEIHAEQAQRRHVPDVAAVPLATRLSLLSSSFLSSWRVRDEIQALSSAARSGATPVPIRELRLVFRRLAGRPEHEAAALATHLWLAHQRVLALQRVCCAARKSQGTTSERMAAICAGTRCSFDDAAWALGRETAPRPGHALDASIQKAREEGYQIPRAPTEARALAELRRIVRRSSHRLSRRRSRSSDAVALPHRVSLRDDVV